jgi:hypothetical protein
VYVLSLKSDNTRETYRRIIADCRQILDHRRAGA